MRSRLIIFLLCARFLGFAQDKTLDSLRQIVGNYKAHDTARAMALVELCNHYKFNQTDSAFFYGQRALTLSRQIGFPKGEAKSLRFLAAANNFLGNTSKALELYLKSAKIAGKFNVFDEKAAALVIVGNIIIGRSQDNSRGLSYLYQAKRIYDTDSTLDRTLCLTTLTTAYLTLNKLDSAEHYAQLAYDYIYKNNVAWKKPDILLTIGRIYQKKGLYKPALSFFRKSLIDAPDGDANIEIARFFQTSNQLDSAAYYAGKVLQAAWKKKSYSGIAGSSKFLAELYEISNPKKANEYSKLVIAAQDSLSKLEKMAAVMNITSFDEKEQHYEIETAKAEYRSQIRFYTLLAGLAVVSLVAFILYRSDKRQKSSNHLLNLQKQEIEAQRVKAEQALQELKATQAQLIQSEKMASLGELTAGIAHEIQNPLNFINNFSDVNTELIEEMEQEVDKGDLVEISVIANNIKGNNQIIVHHGRRADVIVKSMLEHSRASKGEKQSTDINALVEEYLRLSYHGVRAKDDSFSAILETYFDNSIGKVNMVPQDVGRVLLNLFNNAFYAVREKMRTEGEGFEPVVQVTTQQLNGKVEIRVRDNGTGIPEKVLDKIYQPFFTTKPTGEGAGLGLSLSYDIITKAYGGEMRMETKEGEGAEFTIALPVM